MDEIKQFYDTIMEIKEEIADLPGCPLIVAGGIYEEDVQSIGLWCGRSAIGNDLLRKSATHPRFKEAYLNTKRIWLLSKPGRNARRLSEQILPNRWKSKDTTEEMQSMSYTLQPNEAPYCITQALLMLQKVI